MIAIVLAGGYAKRLWPLSLDKPKALLPVAGKPVIDYIVQKIIAIRPPVSKIVVSTNLRFQPAFEQWLQEMRFMNVVLVPDNSRSEADKIGAIRALYNVISKLDEEFLVIAGDTLFSSELTEFVQFFKQRKAPVIALYRSKGVAEAEKGAVVSVNNEGRVVSCIEKPKNPLPNSIIGACLYAFPANIGCRLAEYLSLGLPSDQPGEFIEWLYRIEPVYGFMFKDSFLDIGTPEAYREAELFRS